MAPQHDCSRVTTPFSSPSSVIAAPSRDPEDRLDKLLEKLVATVGHLECLVLGLGAWVLGRRKNGPEGLTNCERLTLGLFVRFVCSLGWNPPSAPTPPNLQLLFWMRFYGLGHFGTFFRVVAAIAYCMSYYVFCSVLVSAE